MRKIASVAVPTASPLYDKPYSYIVPREFENTARPGMRAKVPFGKGNKTVNGLIISVEESNTEPSDDIRKLKSIISVADDSAQLDEDMLKLIFRIRKKCFCTFFEAYKCVVPSAVDASEGKKAGKESTMAVLAVTPAEAQIILSSYKRAGEKQKAVIPLLAGGALSLKEINYYTGAVKSAIQKLEDLGIVKLFKHTEYRNPLAGMKREGDSVGIFNLSELQNNVYNDLKTLVFSDEASCALLRGITGSGKTHIYIKLINDILQSGKAAIMLVPEIALTPQLIRIFFNAFGERIAVMHSALSDGERRDEWARIKSGSADVIIGTRSAVFAPVKSEKLGIIIIDEEQEYSYKSESSPRYHARDIAKYRCVKSRTLLLLASATPSVESMYAAKSGVYKYFELDERFSNASLAEVEIVDRKDDLREGNDNAVGKILLSYIKENIAKNEQTILYINRRGRNRRMFCADCGYIFECPHCSNAMSYHSANNRLMCHICGYSQHTTDKCPKCGKAHIILDKAGTQKLEEELLKEIPGISVIRMDADTTASRYAHSEILDKFRNEKADVLIGTQMVTKGLDFENVTLVGVIDADMSLFVNDFRASERTFSLLTQVVGRSGRGNKEGKAVIQTMSPQNEIIAASAKQDYMAFYEKEIAIREALELPPFCDIMFFILSGENAGDVERASFMLGSMLKGILRSYQDTTVLGPVQASVYKANNKYRYNICVKTKIIARIRDTVFETAAKFISAKENKKISLSVDENPYEM